MTLKQQLHAAVQQYSDALTAQVLLTANATAAKKAASVKEGVDVLAQAVAALGPLNTSGTRTKSIIAVHLTDQAAAAVKVQGKQQGGDWAGVTADAVAAAAVAARALAAAAGQRGWDGVDPQGTQLAAGVIVFQSYRCSHAGMRVTHHMSVTLEQGCASYPADGHQRVSHLQ